jgi:hypothetical protein
LLCNYSYKQFNNLKTRKMAKEKAATPAVAKKKSAPRAKVTLGENSKGNIIKKIILGTVKLASRNDFAGLKNNGKAGAAIAKTDDVARKAASNKVQPKVSPGGSLTPILAAGSGEVFDKLLSLAKAAGPDLAKMNYSGNVKALYDYVAEGTGGSGSRSVDLSNMADLAASL